MGEGWTLEQWIDGCHAAEALNVRYREEIARLTRERDEALRDALRYRWLKGRNPMALATIAWCCKEACRFPDPDRAIDAAMAALEGRDGV